MIVDTGCGSGTLICGLAKLFPNRRFTGYVVTKYKEDPVVSNCVNEFKDDNNGAGAAHSLLFTNGTTQTLTTWTVSGTAGASG